MNLKSQYKLTAKDVSYVLDVSPDDIYDLVKSGQLQGRKEGRFWRFRLVDVLKCKNSMKRAA